MFLRIWELFPLIILGDSFKTVKFLGRLLHIEGDSKNKIIKTFKESEQNILVLEISYNNLEIELQFVII